MIERIAGGSPALTVVCFGFVCWLAGWHMSVRSSGRMYDAGYRAGYTDARKVEK